MKVAIVLVLAVAVGCQACFNNSDMKYELSEEAQLVGYHSLCSEFADRTCCSANNFESLRRKYSSTPLRIIKFFSNSPDTSPACRHVLSTLLCSPCDGDIVILKSHSGYEKEEGHMPHPLPKTLRGL